MDHNYNDVNRSTLKGKDGLEYLKARIEEHYLKEAQIMREMLLAEFSNYEWEELRSFLKQHPLINFSQEFEKWKREKRRKNL